MTQDDRAFVTAVRGLHGLWPSTPSVWSFSSLREAEECPRRWMLSRATYPDVWNHDGYPRRMSVAILIGNVVHQVLERILRALYARGCASIESPQAVDVLKELGGYSNLIKETIEEELGRLEDNPRMATSMNGIRVTLLSKVPEVRQRVQALIARTKLTGRLSGNGGSENAPRQRSLGDGSHPEVNLRVPELRFQGRIDLLTIDSGTCTITDFKTGTVDDGHAAQLKTYALLWSRDRELNPNEYPVEQLVLAYETQDDVLEAPTAAELTILAAELSDRINWAKSELQLRPVPARPSLSMCRRCNVRHMCDDYWDRHLDTFASEDRDDSSGFLDRQVRVVEQNGPRSWLVEVESGSQRTVLRTPTGTPNFAAGDHLRLLGLAATRIDDTDVAVLTMTQSSEFYVLNESPQQCE